MRSTRIMLIIVAIIIFSAINSFGKTTASGDNWQKLSEQSIVFLTMAKDFTEMAKGQRGNITEFQVALDLNAAATSASDYLGAAGDMLWIYDQINNPADRVAVRIYVNKRLDDYGIFLEHLIKQVNLGLSISVSSGIAATGIRLRDELRRGQYLLKSVVIE
ncbi:MAG: hypothetical protein ACLP2P_00495 [Desulfobaccales bacterium]